MGKRKVTGPPLDVVVIGAGPAGLAAALWLGRYRRATLVVDAQEPRNAAARASHGYLTRDGASPNEFLAAARADAESYEQVTLVTGNARSLGRDADDFIVGIDDQRQVAHRLVLATGVKDACPDIPGFSDLYGTSVFHCSCCDGYEARGKQVIAIGWGEHSAGYAIDLLEWGASVTLVTNGETFEGDRTCRSALERNQIDIVEEKVLELHSVEGEMTGARLASGDILPGTMAFFSIAHEPRTDIAQALGCHIDDGGYVVVDDHGETSVPGVYAAGDLTPGEQLIQTAASEGAVAGIACAMSLRGTRSESPAPQPGPHPQRELEAAGNTDAL